MTHGHNTLNVTICILEKVPNAKNVLCHNFRQAFGLCRYFWHFVKLDFCRMSYYCNICSNFRHFVAICFYHSFWHFVELVFCFNFWHFVTLGLIKDILSMVSFCYVYLSCNFSGLFRPLFLSICSLKLLKLA